MQSRGRRASRPVRRCTRGSPRHLALRFHAAVDMSRLQEVPSSASPLGCRTFLAAVLFSSLTKGTPGLCLDCFVHAAWASAKTINVHPRTVRQMVQVLCVTSEPQTSQWQFARHAPALDCTKQLPINPGHLSRLCPCMVLVFLNDFIAFAGAQCGAL